VGLSWLDSLSDRSVLLIQKISSFRLIEHHGSPIVNRIRNTERLGNLDTSLKLNALEAK